MSDNKVIDVDIKGTETPEMTSVRQRLEERPNSEIDAESLKKREEQAAIRREEAISAKQQAARDYHERVMAAGEQSKEKQEQKLQESIQSGLMSQEQAAARREILLAETVEKAKAVYQKAKDLAEKRELDYEASLEELSKKLQSDVAEAQKRRDEFMAKRKIQTGDEYLKAKKLAAKKQINVERALEELQQEIESSLDQALARKDEALASIRDRNKKEVERAKATAKLVQQKSVGRMEALIAQQNIAQESAEARRERQIEETRKKAAADVELARQRAAAKKE